MRLPPSVQRLFHRYHAEQLDTDRHADLIIPTVLADGSLEDWDWLFQVYGWPTIREWIAAPGHAAGLPAPMERFWTLILLGTAQETAPWAGGNGLRRVPADALPAWWPRDDP
jgi:hypothetical protein